MLVDFERRKKQHDFSKRDVCVGSRYIVLNEHAFLPVSVSERICVLLQTMHALCL